MNELALANMTYYSPATIANLTNRKQKLWANQPNNTYCQVFLIKRTE